MSVVFHWIGMALGFLVVGLAIRVFWRGLSLKPNDPLPPGKRRNWRT
jgi:hypothetical protein